MKILNYDRLKNNYIYHFSNNVNYPNQEFCAVFVEGGFTDIYHENLTTDETRGEITSEGPTPRWSGDETLFSEYEVICMGDKQDHPEYFL